LDALFDLCSFLSCDLAVWDVITLSQDVSEWKLRKIVSDSWPSQNKKITIEDGKHNKTLNGQVLLLSENK